MSQVDPRMVSVSTSGLLVVTHTNVQSALADLDAAFGKPAFRSAGNAGLTGATAATRYVGGTTSGAPASGTFAVGDFVVDQTGKIWVCTTAGSPGTWTQAGSSLTVQDENSNVSTSVTQIDFQGAGVTATAGSGEVVVTIPGASATSVTLNAQAGSYTLVLGDAYGVVKMTSSSANTLTVPANASVPFAVGDYADVLMYGTGQTTIAGAAGVTVDSASGILTVGNRYGIVTLLKLATNEWLATGDLG